MQAISETVRIVLSCPLLLHCVLPEPPLLHHICIHHEKYKIQSIGFFPPSQPGPAPFLLNIYIKLLVLEEQSGVWTT